MTNHGGNHRRSIRLQGYDYSRPGAYFITICTQNRRCLFGNIVEQDVRLTPFGKIVMEQWRVIPSCFPCVELDGFVVMPNHVHGIINIVGAPLAGAQDAEMMTVNGSNERQATAHRVPGKRATARVAPTVGAIIGAYKSLCVHHILKWVKQNEPSRHLGKIWQRNYWERIIRNENELNRIRQYIIDNPARWEMDMENTEAIRQTGQNRKNCGDDT